MTGYLKDQKAHLLAVIGRRRIGNTFLIREVYKEHKVFEMTGIKDADLNKQLINFTLQLNLYVQKEELDDVPEDWLRAFHLLSKALPKPKKGRKPVIFFDEVPWIAGGKSGFTEALGH